MEMFCVQSYGGATGAHESTCIGRLGFEGADLSGSRDDLGSFGVVLRCAPRCGELLRSRLHAHTAIRSARCVELLAAAVEDNRCAQCSR